MSSSETKLPNCPNCNTNENVIKIIYGYPSPALFEESKKGHVKVVIWQQFREAVNTGAKTKRLR